jgi:hypothetical protein
LFDLVPPPPPFDVATKFSSILLNELGIHFTYLQPNYAPEVIYATLALNFSVLTILQVVAAVGFKGRRLDIPKDLNPLVAQLIESCWAKYVVVLPIYSVHFYSENLIRTLV